MPDLRLRTIVSAPFDENSDILGRADRTAVLVIDPGFQPDLILDALRDEGLQVSAILNTHGHVDHLAGNAAMKKAFPTAPIIGGDVELTRWPLPGDPVVYPGHGPVAQSGHATRTDPVVGQEAEYAV